MRPKGKKLSKPIPVKMDPALLARIEALANRINEPKSMIMRLAMKIGLDALEKAMNADPKNPGFLYPPLQDEGLNLNE